MKAIDPIKKFKDSIRNNNSSMTTKVFKFQRLWRPHNFRRGIKIFSFDRTIYSKKSFIDDTTIPLEMNSHNKIISIFYSDNITIQIFKEHIIGSWKQNIIKGYKQTILLGGNSKKEVNDKLSNLKLDTNSLVDNAILFVMDKLNFLPIKSFYYVRGENWTRSKHYIDKLPKECIIHEEHWKKVYDIGIEVISNKNEDYIDKYRQLINNEIVLDFAPEIAAEINNSYLYSFDINSWAENHIKALDDVFKYETLISMLSKDKRLELSNFLFERFGGVKIV